MLDDLPRTIGRYEVVGELGSGGMASVYLARAAGIGGFERLLAIKTIHPHLAKQESFVRMFLDEARIAARIRHPNVVQVYEVGEDGGRLFIAMDYVGGEPLSHTMGRLRGQQAHLDVGLASFICFAASEALHAAHECRDGSGNLLGVIHRDVSPKNILIGFDGVPRLLDFGVAKARDQIDITATGTHKGTAAYMAPEQVEDAPIDRRTDVFALGVVLWEITAGRRLFKGSNDLVTSENIRRCDVPRPSSFRPDYPGKLERIVLKALRRDPAERHQTARELGEDLREYLGTRPKVPSSIDVEQFIRTLFADRYRDKLLMEQNAMSAKPTPFRRVVPEKSTSVSDSSSMPGAIEHRAAAFADVSRTRPLAGTADQTMSAVQEAPAIPRPAARAPVAIAVLGAVLLAAAAGAYAFVSGDRETAAPVVERPAPVRAATSTAGEAVADAPAAAVEPDPAPEREVRATPPPRQRPKKRRGTGPTLVGSDDL